MSAVVSSEDVSGGAGTDRALFSAVTRIPAVVAASLKAPKVGSTSWIAPSAQVSGDVKVGDHCSIWYSCTVRGATKLRT
jgi:UDP-3-O-[3-hydroxymyristoyl] glucosamine N-acyltransferase